MNHVASNDHLINEEIDGLLDSNPSKEKKSTYLPPINNNTNHKDSHDHNVDDLDDLMEQFGDKPKQKRNPSLKNLKHAKGGDRPPLPNTSSKEGTGMKDNWGLNNVKS